MSSHDMKNPNGGVPMGHVIEPPDPNNRLLERILSRENMLSAWKRVKVNKGAAGIDKMSVDDFESYARKHWPDIRQALLAGTYQPLPVLVCEYIRQGYRMAVDMDFRKFFDTVNHDVLMHRVAGKVRDKRVLHLIGKYLRTGVMVNARLQQTRRGVPQGSPISPLLANILLDDLDRELERRRHKFVRYADDFVVLVKNQRAGKRVVSSVRRFLPFRF